MSEISLTAFLPEHFAELGSWFSCEREAVQWGGRTATWPVDAAQLQALLDAARNGPLDERHCFMAVRGGETVGHVELVYDWRHGVAMLSRVAVAPAFRGRGLAGPMLRPAIVLAFSNPQIVRLELNVYAWNLAARRTYEKLGFVVEGVRRSAVAAEGERWDAVMMGMLQGEWAGFA